MKKFDMDLEFNKKLSPSELKKAKQNFERWNIKRKKSGLDFTQGERITNMEMLFAMLEHKIEKEFIKVYILITVISISVAILCIFR